MSRRPGDFREIPSLRPREMIAIWQLMDKPTETGCRKWLGRLHPLGYGVVDLAEQNGLDAARVVYFLTGQRLKPQPLLHQCGTVECCEPNHMRFA